MPPMANTIADDLQRREQRDRQQCPADTPHPVPKHDRDDHQDGVQDEAPGQQHRRYGLLDDVNDEISGRGKQGLPDRVEGDQTGQKQHSRSQQGSEERQIVQQHGGHAPKDGIAHAEQVGDHSRQEADSRVHQRDREQISGNVSLDLLRNLNKLLLVAQFGDDFDEPAEKHIAGNEEEEQQHDSDPEARQKALRVQE